MNDDLIKNDMSIMMCLEKSIRNNLSDYNNISLEIEKSHLRSEGYFVITSSSDLEKYARLMSVLPKKLSICKIKKSVIISFLKISIRVLFDILDLCFQNPVDSTTYLIFFCFYNRLLSYIFCKKSTNTLRENNYFIGINPEFYNPLSLEVTRDFVSKISISQFERRAECQAMCSAMNVEMK